MAVEIDPPSQSSDSQRSDDSDLVPPLSPPMASLVDRGLAYPVITADEQAAAIGMIGIYSS